MGKPAVEAIQKIYDKSSEDIKIQIQWAADRRQTARKFQSDKALVKWWDRFCKGRMTDDVLKIIDNGRRTGQITKEQRELLYHFMSNEGYISLDGTEEWY